jgi:hypothetical protein
MLLFLLFIPVGAPVNTVVGPPNTPVRIAVGIYLCAPDSTPWNTLVITFLSTAPHTLVSL